VPVSGAVGRRKTRGVGECGALSWFHSGVRDGKNQTGVLVWPSTGSNLHVVSGPWTRRGHHGSSLTFAATWHPR
ncbi:hypothetical protein CSUI_003492, partial [Cystoisospora suis]